jgi:hypothetical protein
MACVAVGFVIPVEFGAQPERVPAEFAKRFSQYGIGCT